MFILICDYAGPAMNSMTRLIPFLFILSLHLHYVMLPSHVCSILSYLLSQIDRGIGGFGGCCLL